ncbi:MAG: aminoglycoside phosphotransferase family protein [Rickettsiales bacterium]|nr:aminoglycoside phosphotransferase family protein [Rickettsiales bacterium]
MKNSTFFTEDEDLVSILQQQFKSINSIKKISTGWTNIVAEVETGNSKYIIRFPRNNFFAKQIEKDVLANCFLKKEMNLKTVDMNIAYHNERPYSIHQKVPGISLTERINFLSKDKIDKIAYDIALFYATIHNIPQDKIPETITNVKLSNFLTELSKVDDNYYDYSSLIDLSMKEKEEIVLVHGDLNIGNILLDENDEITAFIDFSFVSLSTRCADLSRISCRITPKFLNQIINNYEQLTSVFIDRNEIEKCNFMWKYIEEQYIIYMKKFHPEIKLPQGV